MELLAVSESLSQISKHLALLQNYILLKFGSNWASDFEDFCRTQTSNCSEDQIQIGSIDRESNFTRVGPVEDVQDKHVPIIIPLPKSQNLSISDSETESISVVHHVKIEDDDPLNTFNHIYEDDDNDESNGQEVLGLEPHFENVETFPSINVATPNTTNVDRTRRKQVKWNPKATLEKRKFSRSPIKRRQPSAYKCQRCQMCFTCKGSLKRHMMNATACISQWPCKICDKVFTMKSHLVCHMKGHRNPSSKLNRKIISS